MTTPLDPAVHAKLAVCSSATLTTLLVKRGIRRTAIRGVAPIRRDLPRMVGPAFTLRYIPAREDLDRYGSGGDPANVQRRAIEMVPEGAVFVIDCRGDASIAGIGAILTRRLQSRGVAGLVMDGGVRDTASVAGFAIPVYCAGPSAPPNYAGHHAVDMDQPIACGGIAVYPDDIIHGDSEAVIVIPRHLAAEIAEEGEAMERREVFLLGEIEAGRSIVGVYPPNEETLDRYRRAVARGEVR
jgi:regulator of RNase E activity RraA